MDTNLNSECAGAYLGIALITSLAAWALIALVYSCF